MKLTKALQTMGISTILCDIDTLVKHAQSESPDGYELDGDILEQIGEFFKNILDHKVGMNLITEFKQWPRIREDTRINVNLEEVFVEETSNPWTSVISMLEVKPGSVLAISDTVVTGLWRAHEAGIRKFLWIDKPVIRNFYRTGRTPRNTVVVTEIMDIIPCLMKVPWK